MATTTAKTGTTVTAPIASAFTADILAAVKGNDRLQALVQSEEAYPGIIDSVVAVIGQHLWEDATLVLDGSLTDPGRVKGRSVSADKPDAKIEGEAEYKRPNGDTYYSRLWGTEQRDVTVLRKAREQKHSILMYGPPGTGKTALADAAFTDLETILGTGDTDTSDFLGSYTMNPDGGFIWTDGPLVRAMENGSALLIDEIGLIDPKVMSIVYSSMDGRGELRITANQSRGIITAKPGFYVIAATNPNAPGVRLSEALLSRFGLHVEITTDWKLAAKLGVSDTMVRSAQAMNTKVENGEMGWCPQFRELLAYRDIAKAFGQRFAVQNMIALAPEIERPAVKKVLDTQFGETYQPARI